MTSRRSSGSRTAPARYRGSATRRAVSYRHRIANAGMTGRTIHPDGRVLADHGLPQGPHRDHPGLPRLLRKMNTWPLNGSAPMICCTLAARPSNPARRSIGWQARKTFVAVHVAAGLFGREHEGLGKPPAVADRSGDAAVSHRGAQRPVRRLCRPFAPAGGGSDLQLHPRRHVRQSRPRHGAPADAVKWAHGELVKIYA